MKISVVMTYYKREFQLVKSLHSISKSEHNDFNIIIVDDSSEDNLHIDDSFNFPIDVITITKEEKVWNNPEPAYNRGIYHALVNYHPDIIILQNAESLHVGDVISYAANNINENNYISFACFALDKITTFTTDEVDVWSIAEDNKTSATAEGQMAWYHHPIYRPCYLDFCSAISTSNMIKINGYDERFMYGMGYGDNYLRYRIEKLGLNIQTPDYPIVAHQWHYSEWYWNRRNYELMGKNGTLYNKLSQENNYRAEHIITPDFETIGLI